jgi:AcrR family transcriptional regulator
MPEAVKRRVASTSAAARRGRGRPPDLRARDLILQTARAMLAEGGPASITMERLAARAGVGKPTVYRWWPDRHAVTMAALMDGAPTAHTGRRSRSSIQQLRRQLHAIADRFATPTGRHVAQMIAAGDVESELGKAFRNHFVMARRAEGAALLREAFATGELGAKMDVEVPVDLLYGAIFFRLLMGHGPLTTQFVDEALRHVLRGFTTTP